MRLHRHARRNAIALLLTTALAAGCGGSGGGGSGSGGSSAGAANAAATVYFQDAAAPVTITAGGQPVFEMHELWLDVAAAALQPSNHGALVPLTLTAVPLTVDVMTLDNTSVLLGWIQNFAPGFYRGLELSITNAEMRGTDLVTNQTGVNVTIPLTSLRFEAEFRPSHAYLDPATATSIVVDWRPVVRAQRNPVTGDVTYQLADDVHAFVVGAPGNPPATGPRPVRDVEGEITAIDCTGQSLTILAHHHAPLTVTFDANTRFVDRHHQPLAGGCFDLQVGDEVEIAGHIQPGNSVLATVVRDKDLGGSSAGGGQQGGGQHGGGHHGGAHHGGGHHGQGQHGGAGFESRGVADSVQIGATPAFELRMGSVSIAEVHTSATTRFRFGEHHPSYGLPVDPAQDIYDGVHLKVEGTVTGTNAAGLPVVEADEVEIR
ncbi:MAG: hypothetical protein D6776_06325 [Planctomycetota bacterium]|nr:MAG: hypothetical protein D6776_06325 [Planctomycetota bacterium]